MLIVNTFFGCSFLVVNLLKIFVAQRSRGGAGPFVSLMLRAWIINGVRLFQDSARKGPRLSHV